MSLSCLPASISLQSLCILVAVSTALSFKTSSSTLKLSPQSLSSDYKFYGSHDIRRKYDTSLCSTSNPLEAFLSPQQQESDRKSARSAELIQLAKLLVANDLGLQDPSLLADDDSMSDSDSRANDAGFAWINPTFEKAYSKIDYLAAGRFFDLRSAFPDLDYRAYDYRIDDADTSTVRLTCRVTGTLRGTLRLRTGDLPPNGKVLKCPPEAISITFNKSNQATKLCTGFCLDRQIGNTLGTTGVQAAATLAGKPPSDWELYPGIEVVKRFWGRPVPLIDEESLNPLAPFPENVMIQLAKGILGTTLGLDDPGLLGKNFEYTSPIEGPISRSVFLQKYAAKEFPEGVEPIFTHFRIDPYNPARVWVDVQPVASSVNYIGSPQAMSFTFDTEGFCTRMTAGYVMDPSVGNGGGLGGPRGYQYATQQQGATDILSRPLPAVLGRARKAILSPVTGLGLDDYRPSAGKTDKLATLRPSFLQGGSTSLNKLKTERIVELTRIESEQREAERRAEEERREAERVAREKAERQAVEDARQQERQARRQQAFEERQREREERLKIRRQEREKQAAIDAERRRREEAEREEEEKAEKARKVQLEKEQKERLAKVQAEASKRSVLDDLVRKKTEMEAKLEDENRAREAEAARRASELQAKKEAAEREKQKAAEKRAAEKEARRVAAEQAKLEAKQKREAEIATRKLEAQRAKQKAQAQREAAIAAKKAKAEEAAKSRAQTNKTEVENKRKAELDARRKQIELEEQRKRNSEAAAERKDRQQAALKALSDAVTSATISLFSLGSGGDLEDDLPEPSKSKTTKKAPIGVPTITRWRKNSDGSITGIIKGSRNFKDGERVTTSPIAKGDMVVGEVVRTGSGSRYFLG